MNNQVAMHRCLELAAQGRGLVGGNPLVGSVLVRDGSIIAEGHYRGVGTDHAEVDMIKNCDQLIKPTDGLYVNLEPCCHTGNTPPCTDRIIESGIKRVIIGMQDPDPRVSGEGIAKLRSAGVEVTGPVLRAQCERLNRGYISLRTNNRPYITLKRAQTFEGNVANADGSTLSITSQNQNKWSHANLRATHDAILVGVQTVIADDPQLTNRISTYQPIKIILDPDLRIPRDAKLIDNRTIIITQKDAEPIGDAKVITVPIIDNHFDWDVLWNQFSTFHFPLSTILVEGGPKTWDAFWKASLVDEEVILIGS